MANTHKYEIVINGHTYEGEIELTLSGFTGLTQQEPLEEMAGETEHSVREIFKSAGSIFAAHGSLKKIEITLLEG